MKRVEHPETRRDAAVVTRLLVVSLMPALTTRLHRGSLFADAGCIPLPVGDSIPSRVRGGHLPTTGHGGSPPGHPTQGVPFTGTEGSAQ